MITQMIVSSKFRIVFVDSKVIEVIVLKQYTYEIIVDKFSKDKTESKKRTWDIILNSN